MKLGPWMFDILLQQNPTEWFEEAVSQDFFRQLLGSLVSRHVVKERVSRGPWSADMLLKRECQEMFITPPENVIKKDVDFLQFHRGFFQFFSFKNSVKTKPK